MVKSVKLHDKIFDLYIPSQHLSEIMQGLADRINADKIESPIMLFALSGAFISGANLMVRLEGEWETAFVKIRSYFDKLEPSGRVVVDLDITRDLKGRNVVIFDDTVDTGNTMEILIEMVLKHNPASVRTASMFYKPELFKENFKLDYVGEEIPNRFIVGFGFDYNEAGRNLPDIYALSDKQ